MTTHISGDVQAIGGLPEFSPADVIPGFAGRVSPYFEGVRQAGGGGYRLHFNTFVPWSYPTEPAEQYEALTERVTLWDTATERQLQIKGENALAFADRLVTRDLSHFQPGQCTYTFVCDQNGIVLCDPVLLVVDDRTVWLSISGTDLILWANAVALHTDHDVEISEIDVAPLQLQGPKSYDVLQTLADRSIRNLEFFRCVKTRVAGIDAVVSRTGWTGELGYEIYPFDTPPFPRGRDRAMRLWRALLDAGAPYGLMVTPFQVSRAYEAGIMVFNHGFGENMNALEFWRNSMVDFTGSDFIGKHALEAVRDSGGPVRKMMGLAALDESAKIEAAAWDHRVLSKGECIGTTRRHAFSPALGREIALGLIRLDAAEVGTVAQVEHPGGLLDAKIHDLPFVGARTIASPH